MVPLNKSGCLSILRRSSCVSALAVRAFRIPLCGAARSRRQLFPRQLCKDELENADDMEAIHVS